MLEKSKSKLFISYKYWKFNKHKNFMIRKGIHLDIKQNEPLFIEHMNKNELLSDPIVKYIRCIEVQHIKYSDIINFKYWHLHNKKDNNNKKFNPLVVMKEIYGNNFNENEIVTLIWFVSME